MSYGMKGDDYNFLYRKYVDEGAGKLFDFAKAELGEDPDYVLDLCCGSNLICTKEALNRQARYVFCVDKNTKIAIEFENLKGPYAMTHIGFRCEAIWNYLSRVDGVDRLNRYYDDDNREVKSYDLVVCRQGVNYWFNDDTISLLVKKVTKGGVFVFNTFWKKPKERVQVKEYQIEDTHYWEVSLFDSHHNTVHHTQYAQREGGGVKAHSTMFQWIPLEKFISVLQPYFHVSMHLDGNSAYFVCKRT